MDFFLKKMFREVGFVLEESQWDKYVLIQTKGEPENTICSSV